MIGPAARLIGGTFLERGLITHDQLERALQAQLLTGQLLGEILVARGWITRMELADALAEHWRNRADAAAAPLGENNVFDLDRWREQVERAKAEAPPTADEAESGATEPETVPVHSFVALAQTPDRYRLIECEGAPPAVGERIELPGLEGTFAVFRQGRSPLPLDDRPCVFVEYVVRSSPSLAAAV